MEFPSVQMSNGTIFHGKKIGELVELIVNKFSEAGLSHDEAQIVLNHARDIIGEYTYFKALTANNPENTQP